MKGTCEFCNEVFEQSARNQKVCSAICADKKKNTEANKKWLERGPRKKPKPGLNSQLENMRFREDPVSKRFQAIRG